MTKPIRPEDVVALKQASIPAEVFEVFNALIASAWDGDRAVVDQKEAVNAIVSKMMSESEIEICSEDVFERGWLDIEGAYEQAGWDVEYDKPGYNESYSATFTFSKKGGR